MDVFLPFISLVFLCAGLGIDNGLLIEFSLKSLGLPEKQHLFWRSVALLMAAALRVLFLFSLSSLSFLSLPLPQNNWLINRWFSAHPEELNWMSTVLFGGGIIILIMALWEYYHKFRAELEGDKVDAAAEKGVSIGKILTVAAYLTFMNLLFSLDSVFAAVAIMDMHTQFNWMVAAIVIAALIMIFGMIPISAIIARNKHFGVLMLSILAVIGTKLLVDGTGSHFSNGLLIFIIGILLMNDAAQGLIDWASRKGRASQNS